MDFLENIFNYLTDPSGLGFPMLISAGLLVILWLMNKTSKGWKKADTKIQENKESVRKTNLPYKPF